MSSGLIDRKRNMLKLASGEAVAVEALEAKYSKAHSILQIWIYATR